MENVYLYDTIIGKLMMKENGNAITGIKFAGCYSDADKYNDKEIPNSETPIILMAKEQLEEYFTGKRKLFQLPLNPIGTPFQRKVWDCLLQIPYGETRSYKEVAIMAGNENACRAVGMANNKNPIPILIPCHRVLGSNGKLVGFAGGLDMKQQLLDIEQSKKHRTAQRR